MIGVRLKPTAYGFLSRMAKGRIADVVSQTRVADDLRNRMDKSRSSCAKPLSVLMSFRKPSPED